PRAVTGAGASVGKGTSDHEGAGRRDAARAVAEALARSAREDRQAPRRDRAAPAHERGDAPPARARDPRPRDRRRGAPPPGPRRAGRPPRRDGPRAFATPAGVRPTHRPTGPAS